LSPPALPDVPHCRDITEGMQGVDVVAVKRALSRAGYLRWGQFTALWGDGAIAATTRFQAEHGVAPGHGGYGPMTHAALVATHAKGLDEWAYDGYSIELLKQSCMHPAMVSGSVVRDAILAEAMRLYAHRNEIDYSQDRPFSLVRPPGVPMRLDCSGFVVVCHFVGGAPNPSGGSYDGQGYTGSLQNTGHKCAQSQLQAGDAVFYGRTTVAKPGFPVGSPTHVALYDGDGGVYSQGGPDTDNRMLRHLVNYREVNHYRHYDL
jgi:hypothetical protein